MWDSIHVRKEYDSGRRGFYYLFRFPYNDRLIAQLKKSIQPKGDRFWLPKTKSWHIAEKHYSSASQTIRAHTRLNICKKCLAGEDCAAWSHLDPKYKRPEPHWETTEERDRAQERYSEEQAERRRKEAREYEERQRQEEQRHSRERESFWDDWFSREEKTTAERWSDPSRKPDSQWALRVLGLTKMPTKEELKQVWRALSMEYHPDLNHDLNGDHSKMALINRAKDYLDSYLC